MFGEFTLSQAELLAVLARRDARLTDQEQALVRAALAGAPPKLRAELERRLGRKAGATPPASLVTSTRLLL